jgi:hypothetical protein
MLSSFGTLVSEPKAKSIINPGKWWLILVCCPDLGRYYRESFNYWYRARDIKLMKPAWDCHISVVRGEEPINKELWGSWDGCEVEFRYNPELQGNGEYYWLDVECAKLLDIREKLGLGAPHFGLHLTIGRIT